MGRLGSIIAIALSLAVPVWAQHGGHGGGGGHAGGFGGGHGGGFSGGHSGGFGAHSLSGSGGHVSSGIHSGSGFSRPFTRPPSARAGFSQVPFRNGFFNNGFRGRRGFNNNFVLRNNCYGYGCWGYRYPWWYAGYYDPWWWWDSDSSYNNDYNDNVALADQINEQSLEEQRMMDQEEADGDQDIYARSAPNQETAPAAKGTAFMPDTVLVFRDQHKQEVSNYAIVGQTLWNFTGKGTERIPLADLDLTATADANDARGISFRIPSSNEAQ